MAVVRPRALQALLVGGVLLAACSSPARQSTTSLRSLSSLPSAPASSTRPAVPTPPGVEAPTAPPTRTAPSSPVRPSLTRASSSTSGAPAGLVTRCTAARLAISTGPGSAGLGHQGTVIVFRNTGRIPCTLQGYPGVHLGPPAPGGVDAARSLRGYLGGLPLEQQAPSRVALDPGGAASAAVEGTAVAPYPATSCPSYSSSLVTAPGSRTSIRLGLSAPACSTPQVHPVVPGRRGGLWRSARPTWGTNGRPMA